MGGLTRVCHAPDRSQLLVRGGKEREGCIPTIWQLLDSHAPTALAAPRRASSNAEDGVANGPAGGTAQNSTVCERSVRCGSNGYTPVCSKHMLTSLGMNVGWMPSWLAMPGDKIISAGLVRPRRQSRPAKPLSP